LRGGGGGGGGSSSRAKISEYSEEIWGNGVEEEEVRELEELEVILY